MGTPSAGGRKSEHVITLISPSMYCATRTDCGRSRDSATRTKCARRTDVGQACRQMRPSAHVPPDRCTCPPKAGYEQAGTCTRTKMCSSKWKQVAANRRVRSPPSRVCKGRSCRLLWYPCLSLPFSHGPPQVHASGSTHVLGLEVQPDSSPQGPRRATSLIQHAGGKHSCVGIGCTAFSCSRDKSAGTWESIITNPERKRKA